MAGDERTGPTGVTYQAARESVRARLEPDWKWGTFCLDDRNIVENDEFWVFAVGAREFLVENDLAYGIAGGVVIVEKADGRIGSRASVDVALDSTMRSRANPAPTLRV
jgi:hypothetical protein